MIPASEWVDAEIVWIVTLRWAGYVWHFADARVRINDAGGQPLDLLPCQSPLDIDESLGRLSQQPRGARAAVRVVLPVDPVAYRRDGYRLDSADAEVAYVTARRGVAVQTYERREVIVAGRLREPQYGDPDLPVGTVTASVEGVNTSDRGVLVGDRVFSPFRFTSTAERVTKQHGKPLPVVFGHPGAIGRAGSPAYPVDGTATTSRLLVAGHRVDDQTVQVRDRDGATTTKTTATAVDLLGDEYAYVDVATADGVNVLSDQWWIGWTGTEATLPRVGREGSVDSVGQLALWAIVRSSLPVDLASWFALAPYLDRYRVDGYLNAAIAPYEYVTRQLTDLLPIAVVGGEGGLRPVLLVAPPIDSAPEVAAGRRFVQVGPWQFEGKPDDVRNVVTVAYARDAAENRATRSTTYGSDGEATTARYSRELYGPRPHEVEIPLTDDDATAQAIAAAIVDRDGLLGESARYRGDLGFGWIRVGDWLRLDDPRIDVEGLLVQVVGRRYLGAGWEFDLLRVEVPQRDAGRVG